MRVYDGRIFGYFFCVGDTPLSSEFAEGIIDNEGVIENDEFWPLVDFASDDEETQKRRRALLTRLLEVNSQE